MRKGSKSWESRSPKRNVMGHNRWSNYHGWTRGKWTDTLEHVCSWPLVLYFTYSFCCSCLLQYWHFGPELAFAHIVFTLFTLLMPCFLLGIPGWPWNLQPGQTQHNTHHTPDGATRHIQQQINKRKSPSAYRGQEKKEKNLEWCHWPFSMFHGRMHQ